MEAEGTGSMGCRSRARPPFGKSGAPKVLDGRSRVYRIESDYSYFEEPAFESRSKIPSASLSCFGRIFGYFDDVGGDSIGVVRSPSLKGKLGSRKIQKIMLLSVRVG